MQMRVGASACATKEMLATMPRLGVPVGFDRRDHSATGQNVCSFRNRTEASRSFPPQKLEPLRRLKMPSSVLVPESMDGRPFFKKNLIAMEKNKKMAGGNFPALSGM